MNLSFLSHSKALNKMFVYNHKQSEWRELSAMKTPRAMFGAIVHKGKIVVTGGVNEDGLIALSETYDFGTNKYDLFKYYLYIIKVFFKYFELAFICRVLVFI